MIKLPIMAHYKDTEKGQGLFLTVDLSEQIVKGTYEYTLTRLIDNKLDLSIFDRKYNNDYTGAAAIEPRILLKAILYCYSLGVISSRKIASDFSPQCVKRIWWQRHWRKIRNRTTQRYQTLCPE